MSQVLITGATGFVGGRLAHHLRARGDDVVALVRTPSDDLAAAGIEQIEGGLDALDDELAARVDAIVHAAASVDQDLEVARTVNRDGTRRLTDHARRAGDVRFVHVSTTSVYDLAAIGDTVADESAPLVTADGAAPSTSSSANAYAVTKAEGEAEVARAVADGLSAAILRPPAVLGAGPTSTWGTRVPTRIREGGTSLPHPSTTFGWVHVDDLVDAITAAIDQPVEATVNVVGGHTTFGSYVAAVRAAIPDAPEPPEPGEDARRWNGAYATERLPQLLGVTPRRTFDEAMAEIHAWWSDARTR